MDWKWNYGESVLVLPGGVLSAEASGEQLRVLLWLASDAGLAAKPAQLARLALVALAGAAGGSAGVRKAGKKRRH